MELRVLKYFLAVAREETILGAAEALHLSQPTLSRQLIELEESIGKKLFIRGNRKITLTEEGLFLKNRAEEIVDLVDKTRAELSNSDNIINGDVYIGGGETEAMSLLAKVAHELQQVYPNIRYHLYSGNADDISARLDKGLLDFGLFIEPADITKYNFMEIPPVDTWGVLMLKSSPLSKKAYIQPHDLYSLPLILSRQSFVDHVLTKWLCVPLESCHIVATYNLIYNASLLVKQGMGYAITLDKLINLSENDELCFIPLYPRLEAKLNIVWKKHRIFSKAADKFLSCLKSEFQNKSI